MRKKDTGVAILALIVIGVFAYVYLAGGTVEPNTPLAAVGQPAAVSVPFTQIARGTKSAVKERVNYLITTSDELKELWGMIDAKGAPPKIDFSTQAVAAIFAGTGENFDISVAKVEDTDARTVSISVTAMEKACMEKSKQAAIAPYEIIAVPATTLPFTHTDIVETVGC